MVAGRSTHCQQKAPGNNNFLTFFKLLRFVELDKVLAHLRQFRPSVEDVKEIVASSYHHESGTKRFELCGSPSSVLLISFVQKKCFFKTFLATLMFNEDLRTAWSCHVMTTQPLVSFWKEPSIESRESQLMIWMSCGSIHGMVAGALMRMLL